MKTEDYGNMNNSLLKNKKKGKKKGTLPSYWVNLDELSNILNDIINSSKLIDYGKQKIQGLKINIDKTKEQQSIIWNIEEDYIVLTGIEFSANDIRNIGYNNSFDMYIDNELFFDDIYFKETDEYKIFNVRKLLNKNSVIKFVFKNKNNMMDNVFFHIHYIGGITVKRYYITCIDKDTQEIISRKETFFIPPNKATICPPTIENYIPITTDCQEIDSTKLSNNSEIIFEYEKESQVITHNYNWIFKLYWGSNVDLDLHCEIDGLTEIQFRNKEFILDENNKGWLDYDYTKWENIPEIITLLGFEDKEVTLKVNYFAGELLPSEKIVLEIGKKDGKKDNILKEIEIPPNLLQHKIPLPIAKINLKNDTITNLI